MVWGWEPQRTQKLLYLNGYRDGSKEKRVELLKKAIEGVGEGFR